MSDIALGLKEQSLEAFADGLNASYMSQWKNLGLYDDDVQGWGEAFHQAVTRTLESGASIHFNLSGLNITEALSGDPLHWVGRYTAWELQQIVRSRIWFVRTTFYLDGKSLSPPELAQAGIFAPPQEST